MTSRGHPYAGFRRALLTKNVHLIDAAARQLQHVGLEDALRILVVLAETGDDRFERAAARFAARVTTERRRGVASAGDYSPASSARSYSRAMSHRFAALLLIGAALFFIGWALVLGSGFDGEKGGSELVWNIGGLMVYAAFPTLLLAGVVGLVAALRSAARRLCRSAERRCV